MKGRWAVVWAVMGALSGAGSFTQAASTIALSPCRLEHPFRMLALTAECGTFVTPENPDDPNGRKIELFVARVPASVSTRNRIPWS